MKEITVVNPNDIELNSEMIITPGNTLTQGQPASVNLNILNDGTSTFLGTYSVDLYSLDGSWLEEIGTITESNGLPSGYTYSSPYLSFNTSVIAAEPGTYFLAIQHNTGDDWEITGSSYHQNPVYVTVKVASTQADIYESNNSESSAYNLPVYFSENNAEVLTTGSNNHTGSDYDYYEISLPAGYDYTISTRAHDSFNSGDGIIYTNDVLWSYSIDGTWSNTYDDIMASNIEVANGGSVKFHVAPYFQGEKGTYLLDINISRQLSTGIETILIDKNFRIFPNPAYEFINILNENRSKIDNISIIDISGKHIKSITSAGDISRIIVPLNDLRKGTYFLIILSENILWQQKFIKLE